MKQFNYDVLANPEIFEIACLPPHSSHCCVDGAGRALAQSLCGRWKFHYAETPAEAPAGFQQLGFDCVDWGEIQVPGHIQLQGYGKPHYTNTTYPWDGHEAIQPGEIPTSFNPTGSYVRCFYLDEHQTKNPWRVKFDGAESAIAVWCNGHFVGYSEDSFTPAEFELTPFVAAGENKLAVQVFRYCSGSWLEDQDFWRFSGLFREVWLHSRPKTHVFDLSAKAELNEDFSGGKLTLNLQLEGVLAGQAELICDGQTTAVPIEHAEVSLSISVANPRLWSAENPSLYHYTLRLLGADGGLLETVEGEAGFRWFGLQGGLMLINGKRIVFNGVNRHEWSARNGRCITRAETEADVLTMKRNNINAVRTSHYPNRTELYQLCDLHGLYVIDEMNLETHGSGMLMSQVLAGQHLPGNHPHWKNAVLARARNMYERDKNHPSILIWSCGNESFGGSNLFDVSEYFRQSDTSRLVHYEGIFRDRRFNATSDMESQMYTPAAEVEQFLQQNPEKPLILCEYSHAMGNSLGGISEYTELAKKQPRYQGGFIWDFMDQALYARASFGEYIAYGGDFGDRPTDGNFSCDGIVFADRTLTPKMQEVKAVYQPFDISVSAEQVTLKNRCLFGGTDKLTLRLTLALGGQDIQQQVLPLCLPAGETVKLNHDLKAATQPGEYVVTAALQLSQNTSWAQKGHEIAFGQAVVAFLPPAAALPTPFQLVEGDANLGIRGGGARFMFDRGKAALVSLAWGDDELMRRPPVLNFWRAPVENDLGWNMPFELGSWRLAGEYARPKPLEVANKNGVCTLLSQLTLPETELPFEVSWKIRNAGKLEITLRYAGSETVSPPEFGMMFTLPPEYSQVTYYGRGPEENVVDRHQGARLGIHNFTAAQNLSPYVFIQDCGLRTGARWVKVENTRRGLMFSSRQPMSFSVLHYTPCELENARHAFELPTITKTVVRVALAQMGVGGDNTWGARPLENSMLRLQPGCEFSFEVAVI